MFEKSVKITKVSNVWMVQFPERQMDDLMDNMRNLSIEMMEQMQKDPLLRKLEAIEEDSQKKDKLTDTSIHVFPKTHQLIQFLAENLD